MRPVTLTVAGMRSYRAQRTLNFSDRTLMAILGDTGSGKSSLLEALYGALYGGSTWDDRGGLKAMIADGVQTLQIELVFQAHGQQYKVARSTSRRNYPPSKHVFDGPGGEHLDGERAVNARIVQLIGLTGQEFLRVVILPQGRFGQLLQGTAGERTPILRGILGLGVLDRVREAADTQATELHAALEPIVAARSRLYLNPQAIASTAGADSARHALTVDRLGKAGTALRDLDGAARTVSATLEPIGTLLDAARATDLTPVQQELTAADEAAAALNSRQQELAKRTEALEAQEADVKTKLAALRAAGTTPASLATMTSWLDHLASTLPTLTEEASAHANEQTELAAATTKLAADEQEAHAAGELVRTLQLELSELEASARTAHDKARRQAEHVKAVSAAVAALAPQRDRLSAAAESTLTAAQGQHSEAAHLLRATAGQIEAREALAALQATNAAAHVGKQHQPGQPCPVCNQRLPATFAAPAIVGEQDLTEAVDAAERAATQVSRAERQAERATDAERQKLLVLAETGAAVAAQLAQILHPNAATTSFNAASCAAVIETAVSGILSHPVDAKLTDAQVRKAMTGLTADVVTVTGINEAEQLAASRAASPTLADVEQHRDAADAAYKAAQEELAGLTADLLRRAAEHGAASAALERRRRERQAASARTAQAAQKLAQDIAALPALISGPLSAALNLPSADPGTALLGAGALPEELMQDLRGQLRVQQVELDRLTSEREELDAKHRRLGAERTALRDTRAHAVDRPRASARRTWERGLDTLTRLAGSFTALADNWTGLAATIAAPELPPPPADLILVTDLEVNDARLSAEVARLQARLASAEAHAEALLAAAEQGLSTANARAMGLLATADADSRQDLSERWGQAKLELRVSTAQAERATAQVPIAEGLDVGIAALGYQLRVLRQVKELLNPSSFPQYVVEQRQVALLRIASSLFGKLTRDGYGFGDDFMIVDRRTGQPRPPKTLSGGETFLASLALALALVEVSNRSGGQLDCLFLDEGFGSLDSSILGESLDVLRLQATGGRLVGVISHLHAVAAELDDVLVVTKEVEGSTFRWLDAEERDAYLLDEGAAGLLS